MISGLYAITPDEVNTNNLLAKVEATLQGGATILQYRNKIVNQQLKTQQAKAIQQLCKQYNVPFIINDSVHLCMLLDADGVHIGSEDGNLSEIRVRLGPDKILGASCYNRIELALAAQQASVNYVAFGACFESNTKPQASLANINLFKQAQLQLNIPVVAIGGITLKNAHLIIDAGANAIAVINAIFSQDDVKSATQQFTKLFRAKS